MMLIRGIKGYEFADPINRGLVGFRDVQSTIVEANTTGYSKSGYEEFLFTKTRFGSMRHDKAVESLPLTWRKVIFALSDHMMAESYLTYFHIIESEQSLNWLEDNWRDDDVRFIYYEPRFESNESVVGNNYCGQRVRYVSSPEQISIRETLAENPGLIVSLMDREISSLTLLEHRVDYINDFESVFGA